MPYYMGDYYPGRRYVGDPGLFSTLGRGLGKLGGLIGKVAGGVAGGGVVGGVIAGLPVLFGQGGAKKPGSPLPAPMGGRGINIPGPYRIDPFGALPGGRPLLTREGGQCAPGFHLNKSDGANGPAGTYCVRNRAMNPANPRALRRAIRREKRFVALARRTLAGTGISIGRKASFAKRGRKR